MQVVFSYVQKERHVHEKFFSLAFDIKVLTNS